MFSTICYVFSRKMHRTGAPYRASSDNVDGFLTLRVDSLEEGHSTLRVWPNRYLHGHRIMLCGGMPVLTSDMGVRLFVIEHSYGVWLVLAMRCRNLVLMTSLCYEIRTLSLEPYCCITCSFEFRCRSCGDVS
ncbi:hypothetical protein M9H77_35050 [Catharanthus roseus]|uniref:Uncharacterized protein n=1 Tax=Catharanthus roseus TaxID=4058 RepID=A0ACB9ZRJ5_CATRO|nr:hypothetical protein M9H77_35050 [Catharanthus roseus]